MGEEQLLTLRKSTPKLRTQRHKEDGTTLMELVEYNGGLRKSDLVTNPVLYYATSSYNKKAA